MEEQIIKIKYLLEIFDKIPRDKLEYFSLVIELREILKENKKQKT